jgi:PAS domain S-box-containing protein
MSQKQKSFTSTLSAAERLQLLVASISDYAIYMLDEAGIVSSWNPGAERFKGYTAAEIIGQHFSVFYLDAERAAGLPARALETALRDGRFESEGWRVRKDGSRFLASVVIDPVYTPDGRHIGYAKVTRDITERRSAERRLRESEERFRLLVQGVTDYAIYMLAPDGTVTNWNAGAERIKGYTESEIVNTHFSRFHTPEDQALGLPAKSLGIAAEKGRFEKEGWRVRKDGSRFWAHVVIDAIRDDAGALVGFAKITRDVTERKAAEDELARANAALFQAQKMEAIGQLTGGIAHDFNNLLGVLASGLDVLTTNNRPYAETRMIDSMRRAVERGATLTQQLLSFARQQPLQTDNFNINTLIANFEPVLQRAGNADIEFRVELRASAAFVTIDVARFEAALLNLVVNARDAMPAGGMLRVKSDNVELSANQIGSLPAGLYLKVEVCDTGHGMTDDVVKRAFEPFFTTKELGKGTGLGLSQVYGFIAQSGGEAVLGSTPGEGTTVSLYLPVLHAEEQRDQAPRTSDKADIVLVVEDEPDLLEVAAELVRSIGYEVLTASNGSDAIGLLQARPEIDILFTDVMMPDGISGIELARQARSRWPGLKVVLASGYPLPALRAEHGNMDDYEFMNKPYRLADLAKKLRSAA